MRINSKLQIRDRGWKALLRSVPEIGKRQVRVGVFEGDVAMIFAAHEYGLGNNPERSSLRSTLQERESDIAKVMAVAARRIITGKGEIDTELNKLGMWIASAVKSKIISGPHLEPPLKPATIARKGSSRPLVDTGRLVASIAWKVEGA